MLPCRTDNRAWDCDRRLRGTAANARSGHVVVRIRTQPSKLSTLDKQAAKTPATTPATGNPPSPAEPAKKAAATPAKPSPAAPDAAKTTVKPPFNEARVAHFLKVGNPERKNNQVVRLDFDGQPTTSDADLELIARSFPHLRRLALYGANIDDAGVKHLVKLTNLADLTLRNTEISDAAILELQKLPKLKTLNLRRNASLTNKALNYFMDYPSLQSLGLLYNNFSDDGMVYVQKIKNLRALDIRCCQQIGDDGLAHLKDMPNLRVLKICDPISDAGLGFAQGPDEAPRTGLSGQRLADRRGAEGPRQLPRT